MINKKQISQLARKILRHQHGLQDPQIMHPHREWAIGLAVAVALFVANIGWSVFTYTQYKNVSVEYIGGDGEEIVVYRESLVKAALEELTTREAELNAIVGNQTPPVALPEEEPAVEAAVDEEDEVATTTTETSDEPVEPEVMPEEPVPTEPQLIEGI